MSSSLESGSRRPLEGASPPDRRFGALFDSASPTMRHAFRVLSEVAAHDVPVLLRGESGTGKSTFARALHRASGRSAHPFVPVDCSALTGTLPPSSRAAPATEQDRASVRAFRSQVAASRGGTILLDEVAALSARLQTATLRLVDESRRAGRPPRVHIIASTQRDLEAAVASGKFRKDLFFRLDVVAISIPPLRERREDILPIARHFLDVFARAEGITAPELTTRAERILLEYGWPGNIRELRNAMQRAVVLSRGGTLELDVLPHPRP